MNALLFTLHRVRETLTVSNSVLALRGGGGKATPLSRRMRARVLPKRSREARRRCTKKKAGVAPALILRLKPASPARHCEERSDEAIQFLDAALDCFASLAMTKIKFGGETPTDAMGIMPCRRARPRLQRKAHDCRRSTAALAKGTFVVFDATSGQASWDVAAFARRVLPAPADPSSASSLHPGHSAEGLMPKAARERVATPPAGTALAPHNGLPAIARPIDGRGSPLCN